MFFEYLKKINYDKTLLLSEVLHIPETSWNYWITPSSKIVKNYKQVYYDQVEPIEQIEIILSRVRPLVDIGPVIIMKYEPGNQLPRHTDWSNKSSILIGVSENCNLLFWDQDTKFQVDYTYPILANLEQFHAVNNDTENHRYVLKIPTIVEYIDVLKKLNSVI